MSKKHKEYVCTWLPIREKFDQGRLSDFFFIPETANLKFYKEKSAVVLTMKTFVKVSMCSYISGFRIKDKRFKGNTSKKQK